MIKNYTFTLLALFFVSLTLAKAQTANWWSSSYSNASTNSAASSVVLPKISYTAQNDANSNGISDNVDLVISNLVSEFKFSIEKRSALEQVARSYTYVLMLAPSTAAAALDVNLRDVAATRCAESRLPSANLDIVVEKIEAASLNSNSKQNTYNRYIDLLGDQAPSIMTSSSCEDSYSSQLESDEEEVLDEEYEEFVNEADHSGSSLPCLVLRQFMQPGSSGEQVIKLQTFLVLTNYMYVWPTGHFGSNTTEALNNFQEDNGVDSSRPWAGPATRSKIAEITCNGDRSSVSAAKNGYTVRAFDSTSASNAANALDTERVVTAKNIVSVKESSPVTVEIATSTSSITASNSASSLSSRSGTFDLTKANVAPLYFTVKSNPKTTDLYLCPAPAGSESCNNSNSYSAVRTRYDVNTYDSIPTADRWMFTVYYDPAVWSKGGRVYFKSSPTATPYYYEVGVAGR